jgi:phage terminase large subunit
MNIEAKFPDKLRFLFKPSRYKVARGGRGSAKSWSFARGLLILAAQRPLRILCTREVQKSIRDSVHKLLMDQIQSLGLGSFYDIQQATIKGCNGSEIIFSGLSDLTAESIKSYEGVDIVWIEEAQAVSDRSWKILIPTIRKDGSEIWVTFNPELDTDSTWVRFVENTPPDCVSVEVNYHDNPWFPQVLEAERAHAEATLPKAEYENIWLGKCLPAITGAIYADEIALAHSESRVCVVPYDPMLKVHVIFDLGWNDSMVMGLVQRHLSTLRFLETIEVDHTTLDACSAMLREKKYNWGRAWLPHDGRNGNIVTGTLSPEKVMQKLGWSVRIVDEIGVENGIRLARMMFPRAYIDKEHNAPLLESLKRYRRNVPTTTGEPSGPRHDEFSHCADMFRYVAVAGEGIRNETDWGTAQQPKMAIV